MRRLIQLSLLLLAGCNTLPVGYDQLDRIPATHGLDLEPDTMVTYVRYVALGPSEQLYFGQDSEYRGRCVIDFDLPDTLTLSAISSIQLVLYAVDPAAAPANFVCRPCSADWDEGFANWKMATSEDPWDSLGGAFWHTNVASGTLNGDSTFATLYYREMTSDQQAAVREHGLMFFPLSPQTVGFGAFWSSEAAQAKRPRIRVTYTGGSVIREFEASQDAGLFTTLLPDTAAFYKHRIGSGHPFRTWLKFTLDSIPREATIARAELSFKPGIEYRRSDSIVVGAHRLTGTFEPWTEFASWVDTALLLPSDPSTATVKLDLRGLVQYWTAHPDSNFGLILAADPEWQRLFRLSVPSVRQADHPRLWVQYVMPPQDRFR